MVVAIKFISEGNREHEHVEIVDVMDQKSINGCWQSVSNKFNIPLTDMYVRDAEQRVLPNKDDLERAWLNTLIDENARNNTFQLRLFVSHQQHQQHKQHQQPHQSSHIPNVELCGYLGQLDGWVSIMETINAHVLRSMSTDHRTQEQASVLKLIGRGLSALLQSWYLFTQSPIVHTPTASTFCPLFERFPKLTQEPIIINHLSDAIQIGFFISQLIPLFHPLPQTHFQTNNIDHKNNFNTTAAATTATSTTTKPTTAAAAASAVVAETFPVVSTDTSGGETMAPSKPETSCITATAPHLKEHKSQETPHRK